MNPRLIELSKSMGEYRKRGILTQNQITKVYMHIGDDGNGSLAIYSNEPTYSEIRKKMQVANPDIALMDKIRGLSSSVPSEMEKTRARHMMEMAQLCLLHESKSNPATVEDIIFDLLLSMKNARLVPRNHRMRYLVLPFDSYKEEAFVFYDLGKAGIYEEKDARFYFGKGMGEPIEVIPAKGKLHNKSEFSNMDVLKAYTRNLQEGIKRQKTVLEMQEN